MKKQSERREFILEQLKEIKKGYSIGRLSVEGAVGNLACLCNVVRFEDFRDKDAILKELQEAIGSISSDIHKRDGKKMAEAMSHFVNGAGSSEVSKFQEQMIREHRTLQQSFTKLCMGWLYLLSKQEHYDGRNEASVKLAKSIFAKMDKGEGYLPLI